LYWAELDSASVAPLDGTVIGRQSNPEAHLVRALLAGPRLKTVRIDTVDYTVHPRTVSAPTTIGKSDFVVASDWYVEGEAQVIDSLVLAVPEHNDALPVWDPSVRRATGR
jgi:hypothetical protein